jgi:hypothetical protein
MDNSAAHIHIPERRILGALGTDIEPQRIIIDAASIPGGDIGDFCIVPCQAVGIVTENGIEI